MLRALLTPQLARLDAALRLLPSQCAICHAWPAQRVCASCITRHSHPQARCRRCALPVPAALAEAGGVCGACLRNPPPFHASLCAVPYAWPWPTLIAQFKYHRDPGLARALATLMQQASGVAAAIEQADYLLPMPLAPARLAQRGYNQSALLAQQLARPKLRDTWLVRTRDTPPQRSLTRAERLRNVRAAFALLPEQAAALRGRRLVLVDDVMTSGASLASATQVLLEAGTSHVTALVFARTAVSGEMLK